MRLYIPKNLRQVVINQYHDCNGHFGVDKCYHTLARSYYWPNMFKELWDYIAACVQCNTRNLHKVQPLLQETDIPPYPFAKVSLDISGPFPLTLSGNKYVVSFVDWLSGWIEAFAVPDKTADTVVFLLLNEVIPRHSAMLALVTDNGGENVNKLMKETLQYLNIHHITTSVFHPQSNSKVERSHRSLNNILSKLMSDKQCKSWDIHLPQALAALRFSYSESTGQSPFSLLYGRDAVLPIDNVLQPRRKYYGEDTHKILLEAQHAAFLRVHRRLKKVKKRQKRYADAKRSDVVFQVGDPVYLKNHRKTCKLSPLWQPYFRIIEQQSPLTNRLKNQLTGEVVSSHAEHLRLAKVEWELDEAVTNPSRLRGRNVVSDESTASSADESDYSAPRGAGIGDAESSRRYSYSSESGGDQTNRIGHSDQVSLLSDDNSRNEKDSPHSQSSPIELAPISSDDNNYFSVHSDHEEVEDSMETPQPLPQRVRRVRARSSSEDNIPLAELAKRIRLCARSSSEDNIPLSELAKSKRLRTEQSASS